MMKPGQDTYMDARIKFMQTPWGSFNKYCEAQGKSMQWGRDCMLFGEGRGKAAGEFFQQALEDCGLIEPTQHEVMQ